MQWLTLHVVSTNIVRCEKRTRANFTYQPFSAQVTNMQICSGGMTVQQCTGVNTIRRSQDLKMSKSRWYSWYLKSFSHTGICPLCAHSHLQRFQNWQRLWFCPSSCSAGRHIPALTENRKWVLQRFSFPHSAVQENTGVQDGRKCVGLPLPCYWMVVSTDMLFLQDPLSSCKGNDSVIWGSSSFLEPCDSPYGHQRILWSSFLGSSSLWACFGTDVINLCTSM